MFSRLYIATQVREGGIQKLFNHETSFPLSKPVKKIGQIKYYFLSCIKTETEQTEPWTKTAVIEGYISVNIAKPGIEKTFTVMQIIPSLLESRKVQRVDIAFDVH